jgi:hypothetical protein
MEGATWNQLPNATQRQILEQVPLLKLAQLARLSQGMNAAYAERVDLREAIISNLPRANNRNPASRPLTLGDLLDSQPLLSTALPRDLVGVPEVCIAPFTCHPSTCIFLTALDT